VTYTEFNAMLGSVSQSRSLFFTPDDLRAIFPDFTESAFNTLLSCAAKQCYLINPCRGLYLFDKVTPITGLLLFHVAVV